MFSLRHVHTFLSGLVVIGSALHASTYSASVSVFGDTTPSSCSESGPAPVTCTDGGVSPNGFNSAGGTATSSGNFTVTQ